MNVATGTFLWRASDTASTVLSKTGLDDQATWETGTTPTFILFFWSDQSEATDAAAGNHYHAGWGAVAGASDRGACAMASEDGVGSTACKYWLTDEHCVVQLGFSTDQGKLDFSSFDTDGFSLVVDEAMGGGLEPGGTDIRVSFIAVDTVSADIGAFQASGSTGTQAISTAVDPTCVMLGSVAADSAPPSGFRNGCVSLGVATGPAEQWVLAVSSQFNVGTSNTAHYLFDGECAADGNMVAGITSGRGELDSFGTGQFTINWLARNLQNHYLYVALSGADFHAGTVQTKTDGADISASGFGFSPLGMLFASAGHAENAQDTPAPHNEISMGFATSPTERVAQAAADEDNLATTECMTAIEHDAVYINPDLADGVEGLMDLKSLDSDGFTTVMDDPDPSAAIVGFLAVGDGAVGQTLNAEAGAYSVAGQDTSLLRSLLLSAESGAYSLTGAQADLLRSLLLDAESGAYSLTGADATLLYDRLFNAESGSYSLTGAQADLARSFLMNAEAGSYSVSGGQADLLRALLLTAESGSYSVSGQAATMLRSLLMDAESGSYSVAGQAAELLRALRLDAEAGTYSLTGAAADLLLASVTVMNAEAGSYSVSGSDADLLRDLIITAEAGSYVVSGQPAALLRALVMAAEAGDYQTTGQSATLLRALVMAAESGQMTVTGGQADLLRSLLMDAEAGSYTLAGEAATLAVLLNALDLRGPFTMFGEGPQRTMSGEGPERTMGGEGPQRTMDGEA